MKERILQTLTDLRKYALDKGYEVTLFYHEEDSYLMRFANSAISLNTNEHLIRLEITAYAGQQTRQLRTHHRPGQTGRDETGHRYRRRDGQACPAAELPADRSGLFANPSPTKADMMPPWRRSATRNGWQYFNQAAAGLETEEIKLSGIFSSGVEHHRPDQYPLRAHPVFQDLRCAGDHCSVALPPSNGK